MSRILITGLANSGKTSLLKSLKDVLVVSRDGKPFSLPLPHYNVTDYTSMDDMLAELSSKLEAYKQKMGKEPKTIAFDSVSRIFTDIETYCSRKFRGFDVWSNVNKEINAFVDAINEIEAAGYNIVLVAHCVWDEKAGKYIETAKGSFAKTGGFLSVTDYAVNINVVGKKHIVTLRGSNLSRTLLEDMPEQQDSSEFNLQNYLDKISNQSNQVTEKWSI